MPSRFDEERLLLFRQQRSIQVRLQQLLDAQSEGLLRGLGRPVERGIVTDRSPETYFSSKSSFTSKSASQDTSQSPKSNRKHIGLNTSRRGIARALAELTSLKEKEIKLAQLEAEQTVEDLAHVQGLNAKETSLKEAIQSIENEEVYHKVQEHRREEKALSREIIELENRLWEMRTRQQHLSRQIQSLDNKAQSRISSYKTSLGLAQKEVRDYLARPPEIVIMGEKQRGFWALPPERRTIPLATEHLQQRRTELVEVARDLGSEKTALKEGSIVWQDVVSTVTMIEELLRQEMQRVPDETDLVDTEVSTGGLRIDKLLSTLQEAQGQLVRNLDTAQDKDWKLLVCSISAELEAIIEGSNILRDARDRSRDAMTDTPRSFDDVKLDLVEHASRESTVGSQGQSARESFKFGQRSTNRYDDIDENDGPGPDLLISTDESPS